jgi:hypothetical protein
MGRCAMSLSELEQDLIKQLLDQSQKQAVILSEVVLQQRHSNEAFADFRKNEFKPLDHWTRNHAISDEQQEVFIAEQETVKTRVSGISKRVENIEQFTKKGIWIAKHWHIIMVSVAVVTSILGTTTVDFGAKLLQAKPPTYKSYLK